MSLPSLSTVLRGIRLPGSPPYKGSQRDAAPATLNSSAASVRPPTQSATADAGSASAAALRGQPPTHQDRVLTPVSGLQRSESSGGYRRRRDEPNLMSEIESPGGSVLSDVTCSTATYAPSGGGGGGGGSWGGSSWGSSDHEGGGHGSSDYDAMQQRERQAVGIPSSPGGLLGGGTHGSGSGNSKRAKLTPHTLSRLGEPDCHHGMGITGGSGIASLVGGSVDGARSPAGLLIRGDMMRARPGFDNSHGRDSGRHGDFVISRSSPEWLAVEKAGRVLGVDSLEERDAEDQRRASSLKAARILGVENIADVAELQRGATAARDRKRQNWAPPRSSASRRPARTDDLAAEAEGQGEGMCRGRKPTTKTTHGLPRSASLSTMGAEGDTGAKTGQGSISSLIRALEIDVRSEVETSQCGSTENGDGSSVGGDNGSEDLPRKKGGAAGRKQETDSNRSTRATESCSSVSDLAHTDPDGMSSNGGSALGDACTSPASFFAAGQQQQQKQQQKKQQQKQHTRQQQELSDDSQLVGLQTPAHSTTSETAPDGLRSFSKHNRDDDMDIETPPSQPRSAALTSLRKAPAPLLAPYTQSLTSASSSPSSTPEAASSPSPEFGPGPSPCGSPFLPPQGQQLQQQQQQPIARHSSDFARNEKGAAAWSSPPSAGAAAATAACKGVRPSMVAEEKGGRRDTRVSEVLDESPSCAASVVEAGGGGGGAKSWNAEWNGGTANAKALPAFGASGYGGRQGLQSSASYDRLRISPITTGHGGGGGFRLAGPGSFSSWGTTDAAGCKESRPQAWSEYKQKSSVTLQQPAATFADAPGAACDEKRGRWSDGPQQQQQQQRRLPEFKYGPSDVAPCSTDDGWELRQQQQQQQLPPVGLMSRGATGVHPYPHPQFHHHQYLQGQHQQQQQQHELQPMASPPSAGSFSSNNSYADHHNYHHRQQQQHHQHHHQQQGPSTSQAAPSPVVFGSASATLEGYGGLPLTSVGGSESSGDSDSLCDTYPDEMDEGEGPAPSSAFDALARLIPVVNPIGIARQQIQHPVGGEASTGRPVKMEEFDAPRGRCAAAAVSAADMTAARSMPKARRRSDNGGGAKVNLCAEEGVTLTRSPLAASCRSVLQVNGRGDTVCAVNASVAPSTAVMTGTDDRTATGGISTRKQQEVATRPREKGRFVKRAPAFLPISAFKPNSDKNEAAEAAEAAEEARQKADEAAAIAAAAAAAAGVQRRPEVASSSAPTSTSTMMLPPPAVGKGEKADKREETAPRSTVGGEKSVEEAAKSSGSSSGSSSSSSSTPSTAPPRRGVGGGASRGRGERTLSSPPSRAPTHDIWPGEDGASARGDGDGPGHDTHGHGGNFGGGGAARDPSVSSDCGSEGGGELRGMAFLPCSPMDRHPSPGGSVGPSSSSAWDSPSPRGGRSGSRSGAMNADGGSRSGRPWACSPRGGAGAGAGGAPFSAPLLADVPVGLVGDGGGRSKAAAGERERGRSFVGGSRGEHVGDRDYDNAFSGRGERLNKVTREAR